MKKLFAIVLTLALVMCLCLPALAAGDHKITINATDPRHKFEAYQIFSGDVVVQAGGNKVLSNVQWGTGVDTNVDVLWDGVPLNLLEALASSSVNPSYYQHYIAVTNAQGVSDALAKNNTTAHAMAFASIVGKYLTATYAASAPITDGSGNVTGHEITGLDDGYYLIKEQTGNDIDPSTHTSYILQLVEDVNVNVKAGDVTVDKTIMDGHTPTNIADYSIGDTVTFQIEGTLPANYVRFTDYEYTFKDTMSKGLTMSTIDHDGDPATAAIDVKVEFDNDASLVLVDPSLYTVDIDVQATGETKVDIKFEDLKVIGEMAEYTVNADTKIIVTYNAVVNEDAVIGGDGNPNVVYLEFDNDPYSDGKGETPEDEVYVFTFELDVNKIDGTNNSTLAGVEFKLYREHGGQKQYVVIDAENKVTGYTNDVDAASVLTTDSNGKFNVIGLEASEYTLTETKELPGYNKIDDITFTLSATYDAVELKITDLTITVEGQSPAPGNATDGVVEMTVVNNPGNTLPATGGLGTTLFFTFGGMLFAGSGVLMVTKRRMSAED